MKSPIKIELEHSESDIYSELLNLLKVRLNVFYESNKNVIDDYLYMKSKLEELEYRLNFHYKLNILNSKTSGQVINAKVKFPYISNEDGKSKYPYLNVHIGKLSDFKGGVNDPEVKIKAAKKIKEYIDAKHPFTILSIDNQVITLYFKKIK
jgi:hypothetical protein